MKKTVIITGASSFTGLWIAREFSLAKWSVHGTCSQKENFYEGLTQKRVERLKTLAQVHFNAKAERGDFTSLIKYIKPQIWIHHHHYMKNFRSKDYDLNLSLKIGLKPLLPIVKALKENDVAGVIYSGSYFEPKEGDFSGPYGESKALVGSELQKICLENRLPFSKIVIPDPVGPLENEDRFIPQIIKAARANLPFTLHTPNQRGNHIPVGLLAQSYLEAAENLFLKKEATLRPSGWVGLQKDWLKEIETYLLEPLNLKIKTKRFDKTKATDIDWAFFWKNYLNWIKTDQPWPPSHSQKKGH